MIAGQQLTIFKLHRAKQLLRMESGWVDVLVTHFKPYDLRPANWKWKWKESCCEGEVSWKKNVIENTDTDFIDNPKLSILH